MHWYGWNASPWMWGMMVLMVLFWIALIGGIIWLIVYLARRSGSTAGTPAAETALDILNKRYARGEITREDYERMKREVGES